MLNNYGFYNPLNFGGCFCAILMYEEDKIETTRTIENVYLSENSR